MPSLYFFWHLFCIVVLGGGVSSQLVKFLYPKSMRTPQNLKIISNVGKMILVVLGVYTFIGFLVLLGFYRSSAIVQLILVCVLNGIAFMLRFFMRRLLFTFELSRYEGPSMFFLLTISQFVAIQSIPKATQIYVLVGSLVLKIFSGLWPLLSKLKVVLYVHRFTRVGVINDAGETGQQESKDNPILFWDPEKEAVNSFATMWSTVASSVVFIPVLMFLRFGYTRQFFIYDHLTSYELISACIYIGGSAAVAIATFLITNVYFQIVYKVDPFQLGVQNFLRYYTIYVSAVVYSVVMFTMTIVRHLDLIYYVAKPLYGV